MTSVKKELMSVPARRKAARMRMLDEKSLAEREPISEETKRAIVHLVQHGATITELEAREGFPSAGRVHREMVADTNFAKALHDARVICGHNLLDESQDQLRIALESNDPDLMRIASDYQRATAAYVEKVAPRQFGQLLKLGGADGGALTIAVVQYSGEISGGKLESTDFIARDPFADVSASPRPQEMATRAIPTSVRVASD